MTVLRAGGASHERNRRALCAPGRRLDLPLHQSDWSDANSIANALAYHLDVLERRRGKERLVPFHVERLDYRGSDPQGFAAGLARSGPKAVREFQEAGL